MNFLKKNLVFLLLVVVCFLGLYWFLFMRGGSTDTLTSSESLPTAGSSDLLTALGNLQNVTFDISIFKDPVFLSLTDFGVVIPAQPLGRPNPFAPLPFGGSSSSLPAGITSGTATH